ncbi:hypothetical protein ACWKYD_04265 [Enterobacter cloacae]
MSTITKDQAQKIIEAADEVITALAGTNENFHPGSDNMLHLWDDLNDRYAPPGVVRELARIALESLEAEPVAWRCGSTVTVNKPVADDWKRRGFDFHPLYAAPPAQEVPEVYNIGDATMRHIFTPAGITDVSDMQAVFDQIETVLAGMWQPAPVVPEEIPKGLAGQIVSLLPHNIGDKFLAQKIWNTCRSAMLQGVDNELQRKAAIHDALCEKYNVDSLSDFVAWQRNHIAELEAAPPAPVGPGETAVMPDYAGYALTQRECFQAGWEAHHAAMLRAGAPVQFGWSKGHFGYHTLFNAIGKAVNIQGGALSISVSAFEDAMLAAAPRQEVK